MPKQQSDKPKETKKGELVKVSLKELGVARLSQELEFSCLHMKAMREELVHRRRFSRMDREAFRLEKKRSQCRCPYLA